MPGAYIDEVHFEHSLDRRILMAVSTRTKMIVWGRSAARCAHPDCRKPLVEINETRTVDTVLGEIAHIVSQSPDGPRGRETVPGGELDQLPNLLLLCQDHHTLIDRHPDRFPVAKLLQWRTDHERWVDSRLHNGCDSVLGVEAVAAPVNEAVHSTMLPVQHIPRFIYLAQCSVKESDVRSQVLEDMNTAEVMAPFIIRGGNLMTFCDLNKETNPFRSVIDPFDAEQHHAESWWDDPDQSRWYMELLNRSLNKLTGRRALNLDKEHKRYYFETEPDGSERTVHYRAIGGRQQLRQVAWQPRLRATGEKKHYWEHLAVGLRFHRVGEDQWCLTVRPERRFTRDGYKPLTPKGTGRRSTSSKSRMYNFDVLSEVHFWRDYLSGDTPRILFRFGKQSIVIKTTLMSTTANWPSIMDDDKRRLKILYEDDLLSLADYNEAIEFEDEAALELTIDDQEEAQEDASD